MSTRITFTFTGDEQAFSKLSQALVGLHVNSGNQGNNYWLIVAPLITTAEVTAALEAHGCTKIVSGDAGDAVYSQTGGTTP